MTKYPNIIQCGQCKMILISFDRHDFRKCHCPNETFIDGGNDYMRCGGKDFKKIIYLMIMKRRKRNARKI